MEMHSRKSLYEIHGISALPRGQPRWRLLVRLGIVRILAVLKAIKNAVEAELASRHAIAELASMDDRMLRDLGITRNEIENKIRWPRGDVGMDDGAGLSSEAGEHRPALPAISSPALSSDGQFEQQSADTTLV